MYRWYFKPCDQVTPPREGSEQENRNGPRSESTDTAVFGGETDEEEAATMTKRRKQ